jgi:glycosyltransferase involved in cell wall biosynthesis
VHVDVCKRFLILSVQYAFGDTHDVSEDDIANTWNIFAASALSHAGGCKVVSIRPTSLNKFIIKSRDNLVIILVPYKLLYDGDIDRLKGKLRLYSSQLFINGGADYLDDIVEGLTKYEDNIILYIHEYKNIRYYNIFKKYKDFIYILQQHSHGPFTYNIASLYKINILKNLKRAGFFALSLHELLSLKSMKLGRLIKLRPMAVNLNELPYVTPENRCTVRCALEMSCDKVVLSTYVGTPYVRYNKLYDVKGSHYLPAIIKVMNKYLGNRVEFLVFGVSGFFKDYLELLGNVKVFPRLPRKDFLTYLLASDIYFLPAHSDLRFTGIGVTVMEALGMGVPVVSPTLIHIPDLDVVDDVGVVTPYLRSVEDAVRFARQLLYTVENLSTFKPAVAREIVKKFYSWESFVNDFKDTVENIMNY